MKIKCVRIDAFEKKYRRFKKKTPENLGELDLGNRKLCSLNVKPKPNRKSEIFTVEKNYQNVEIFNVKIM